MSDVLASALQADEVVNPVEPLDLPAPVRLFVGEVAVVSLSEGGELRPVDSPRPFAHPVTTLAGVAVTEIAPADHLHHVGVSLAPADVDGTSYWGGRTYVRDVGSTMLDNHGRQRVRSSSVTPSSYTAEIEWRATPERLQATEQRQISVAPFADGWVLHWASQLTPEAELSLGSPATNGRPGAFYGGWFWRSSVAGAQALVAEGEGEEVAHGSTSPWLAVRGGGFTLIAVRRGLVRPWFIRTGQYTGFGPALAWEERLVLTPEAPLDLEIDTAVLDGERSDSEIRNLAQELLGA